MNDTLLSINHQIKLKGTFIILINTPIIGNDTIYKINKPYKYNVFRVSNSFSGGQNYNFSYFILSIILRKSQFVKSSLGTLINKGFQDTL